jgi:hypothetical protein
MGKPSDTPSTGSTKVAASLGTFALLLFLFAQPMAATPSQPRIRVLILDGRSDVVVHRLGDDPIHHGMPRAWKTPTLEIYYYARGPAKRMRVLSYGYDQHIPNELASGVDRPFWPGTCL